MDITRFVFTPFQENTYVVFDDTNECAIIDPGCHNEQEQKQLTRFIEENDLTPVRLLNTHCHVDHIAGNHFVSEEYDLQPELHEKELPVLEAADEFGKAFGFTIQPSPKPGRYLEEGETIEFGETKLEILFTPGHSPGSISFFHREDKILISGDVLFLRSIGRHDFPGGDYETLIKTIKEKVLPLGDEVTVYSGHGPETTIGFERENNPFLQEGRV